MKRTRIAMTIALLLGGAAQAQGPAAAPKAADPAAQQAMMRQMQMMAVMFDYRRSRLGYEETVKAISQAATKRGWKVDEVTDVEAAMKQAGVKDVKRMKVVQTCPPGASERLAKAGEGKLPPLPCRYTVFQGQDGKTYVVRMNTGNIAKGLQGEPARIMAQVAGEEEALLKGIAE